MGSAAHQDGGFDIRITLNAHSDTAAATAGTTSTAATSRATVKQSLHGNLHQHSCARSHHRPMASSSSHSQQRRGSGSGDLKSTEEGDRQVVIITGCSSGIGRATALYFVERGWEVCGTVRDESKLEVVSSLRSGGIFVAELDLADGTGVSRFISEVIGKYGRLDAVVSCAGHALVGALELCTHEQWTRVLSVNVAGPLTLIGAALPYLRRCRQAGGGTAVLVSSALGAAPLPLTAAYAACKAAIDAAALGAAAELKAVGVRIKVVLPGRVTGTHFIESAERAGTGSEEAGAGAGEVYEEMTRRALEAMQMDDTAAKCSSASDVARVLWEAVTDNRDKLRYVVGQDAKALLEMKKHLTDEQLRDELIARFALF